MVLRHGILCWNIYLDIVRMYVFLYSVLYKSKWEIKSKSRVHHIEWFELQTFSKQCVIEVIGWLCSLKCCWWRKLVVMLMLWNAEGQCICGCCVLLVCHSRCNLHNTQPLLTWIVCAHITHTLETLFTHIKSNQKRLKSTTGSVWCGQNPKYPPKAVNQFVFGRNNEFESDSFCASNPIVQQLAIRKFWEYLRVISTRLSHRKQASTKKIFFFQIFDNVKIHLMTPHSVTSNIYTVHTTGYQFKYRHSVLWTAVPMYRCGSRKM